MTKGITVIEHILLSQTRTPGATGAFTRLLNQLIVAAKLISREVNKAGLVDILGFTGRENVQGEQVRKLDDFSNETVIRCVEPIGVVCAMSSEEVADIIEIPREYPIGSYVLIFDPLDGSSNIDVNVSVGTIFSIFHRVSEGDEPGTTED
ncbi:MAG: class 1 fructose-bisphosphatase, partial [Deltaproteobacteria bacterium]|nr:class 1 fructose-bisphosphatase [Deltaproteobacteria bacterium]